MKSPKGKGGNPKGNPQNLRPPWPKGVSGNPGGRPRKPLREAISRLLSASEADTLIRNHIKLAARGNVLSLQFLRDTFEGKPSQSIEHSGELSVKLSETLRTHLANLEEPKE